MIDAQTQPVEVLRFEDAGNYRGCLEAKRQGAACYWRVDCDIDEEEWQPIPLFLYEALSKYAATMEKLIDIQALAQAAGLEQRGSRFSINWEEDDDLHISGQDGVSMPFLRAFANAVLEAAASRLDTASDFSDNRRCVERCAAEVRALKVTP